MKSSYSFLKQSGIGFFLSMLLITSVAQVKPYSFSRLKPEDFQVFPKGIDSTSEAVVLGDKGESYMQYNDKKGFQIIFERHLRIRILSKEGYDFATQSIPIYKVPGSGEVITELKGTTYNLVNGKVEDNKLEKENIFEEFVGKNRYRTHFTMPDVKVGSIIDIRYRILSDYLWNLRDWEFQSTIPVQWSEYTVTIPEYYIYSKFTHGAVPFVINESTGGSGSVTIVTKERGTMSGSGFGSSVTKTTFDTHKVDFSQNIDKFAAANVPPIRTEPYSIATTNFISKVVYELQYSKFPGELQKNYTTSWKEIGDDLLKDEDFGAQLKRGRIVKDAVAIIAAGAALPIDRMRLAHSTIRSHMSWNGKKGIYPSGSLNDAWSKKTGNDADVNLLLVLLLKELGIEAAPLVLSTRENGLLLDAHPVITQLNYVIASATIDGKTWLLDATGKYRPWNCLPSRCLNREGLQLLNDSVHWLPLISEEKNNSLYYGEFKISPDEGISGQLTVSHTGFHAVDIRDDYFGEGREKYLKSLREKLKTWQIGELTVLGADSLSIPVKTVYTLSSDEIAQVSSDKIYINVLAGFGEKNNPFTDEKRENVIDFIYPVRDTYVFNYEIPEGYVVESFPQQTNIQLGDKAGSFRFGVSAVGNKITVNSTLTLTRTMFTAAEYNDLREFFARIVAIHAEQIILKKA